jgi:NAD+ synthase
MRYKDFIKSIDYEKLISDICDFIKESSKKREVIVIGLSGGLDSTLTTYLSVEAVGKRNVFGLILPEKNSSIQNMRDATALAHVLDIDYRFMDITKVLKEIGIYRLSPSTFLISRKTQEKWVKRQWKEMGGNDVFLKDLASNAKEKDFWEAQAYYRAKVRLRTILLYFYADMRNGLVLGNTNKTDILTGLYVRYGDDAADIAPIANIYKTQIREIAKKMKIPRAILEKTPSPDLIPGIDDEFILGLSYEDIDEILYCLENNLSVELPEEKVNRVREIMDKASLRSLPKHVFPFNGEKYIIS